MIDFNTITSEAVFPPLSAISAFDDDDDDDDEGNSVTDGWVVILKSTYGSTSSPYSRSIILVDLFVRWASYKRLLCSLNFFWLNRA